MLGRIITPLIFIVEGKEVKVRDISELKKYFHTGHLEELINALCDNKLEQFFFGHGKDEIRDLIVESKKNSEHPIIILNKVAEKLGVERLQIDEEDITFVSSIQNAKEIFESKSKQVYISDREWKIPQEEISYQEKTIIGRGIDKTFLNIQHLSISGAKDRNLTLKKLTITSKARPGILVIKNAKVVFNKVKLSNISILAENAELYFIDIVSDEENSLSIEINNGSLTIANCMDLFLNGTIKINSGKLEILDSDLKHCEKEYLFYLVNSVIKLKNSQIRGGIRLEFANFEGYNIKIYNSNVSGLTCKGGNVFLQNSMICENNHCGLEILEDTIINLKSVEVYNNGKQKERNFQIYIEKSKGEIKDSKIHTGTGIGLYCSNSSINITNTHIFKNNLNGMKITNNSTVRLELVEIYQNGNQEGSYPQIVIEKSKGTIKDAKIYEGTGTGLDCSNSAINVTNTYIFKNIANGILIRDNSTVRLELIGIYQNGNQEGPYPQIAIEKSKVEIKTSTIYSGINNYGININYSNVYIYECLIYQNKYGGIKIYDNSIVEVENTKIFENGYADGIGIYKNTSKAKLKNVNTWGNKWGLRYNVKENVNIINCDFKDGTKINTGCFITSTVLYTLGKDDNCYELNIFRAFRDTWLKLQPDGKMLIEEYYTIAPLIVNEINKRKDKYLIYKVLWNQYLNKALHLLEEGKYNEAKKLYIEMIKKLKERFLSH